MHLKIFHFSYSGLFYFKRPNFNCEIYYSMFDVYILPDTFIKENISIKVLTKFKTRQGSTSIQINNKSCKSHLNSNIG